MFQCGALKYPERIKHIIVNDHRGPWTTHCFRKLLDVICPLVTLKTYIHYNNTYYHDVSTKNIV